MDVRIGVTNILKELEVELPDGADAAQVKADIEAAMAGDGVLWLTDKRGRQLGVPAAKIAYVDLGSPDSRRIGFAG